MTGRRRLGRDGLVWGVVALMALALAGHLLVLHRDLPLPDMDEPIFVGRATRIAATGDWNPHWFGHPGSTVIYPLVLLFRAWYAVAHGGSLLGSNPGLLRWYPRSHEVLYTLGRLWVVTLAVGTIPLVYLVGRRAFGRIAGFVGAALWTLVPLAMHYGTTVRTDSAGVFFGLCALLGCLRVLEDPSYRDEVLAGVAIGLAVASRWFLVVTLTVLVAAHLVARRRAAPIRVRPTRLVAGLAAAGVTFFLVTPYVLFDLGEVERSLQRENLSAAGHEGLGVLGNLRWYLGAALPAAVSWPVALAAAAGLGFVVLRRRRAESLLLGGFALVFLVALTLSNLHWDRWILPIVPVVTLFAGAAVQNLAPWLSRGSSVGAGTRRSRAVAAGVGASLLAVVPAHALLQLERRESRPSTRVLAQQWLRAHVPVDAAVLEEFDTAPIGGKRRLVDWRYTIVPGPPASEDLLRYDYLVLNGDLNRAFFDHPRRYSRKIAFYRAIFAGARLVRVLHPTDRRIGPRILIYKVERDTATFAGAPAGRDRPETPPQIYDTSSQATDPNNAAQPSSTSG